MKKISALLAVVAVVATAGSALAAGTGQLTVTATVLKACSVTGSDALAFGSLNPTTAPLVTQPSLGGISITCTKGSTIAASYDAGSNAGTAGGTDYMIGGATGAKIGYSLALTLSGGTTATGTAQAVSITGTIPAGSYNLAPADSYNDTVNITALAN
jgi:spore coat protein U-like protein